MEKDKNKSTSSIKSKNISKKEEKDEQDSEDKVKKDEKKKDKEEEEEEPEEEITVQEFGENPNLLQIIKGNGYYLLNRDNFDVSKIMMLIDYQRLSMLGESFRNYESPDGEDGVLKIDFTKMIFRLIKDKIQEDERTDLVYGLHKFFCEIDFNGDGHMEWAEFTQFIIDKVEGEFSVPEKGTDNKNVENTDKDLVKYKRYELSQTIQDSNIHKRDINATDYMNSNNRLLLSEYNSNVIKIYNPLIGKIVNTLDILKINYNIEKEKINEIIRGQKAKSKERTKTSTKAKKMVKYNKTDALSKILGQHYLKKKLEEQSIFNQSVSIINLISVGSVIAVLLSNRIIQFFTTLTNRNGDLIFEIKTSSLQKRIWHLKKHNKWFCSGDREQKEKYYYLNELDVDFEIRLGLPVPITENLCYRNRYCVICQHKNEIYDVIETTKPFLVLTACLDGLIRLIDIKNSDYLKTWSYHKLGVKHLDYNPNLELNGYIISTGFEYYINLFNTDMSVDDAYKGKLEGHFVPVINCKFICNSPICVSVDEEGNVRIWDVLIKTCLQSIPVAKKNFTASGLLMMDKINKFIVYGKIMLFYDSKLKEENKTSDDNSETVISDNFPIKIGFNIYYQHFYVTTQRDIRIFNKYGELEKTFKKCVENEDFESGVRIRNFIFEDHYRKFYLCFSNGAIMQYNAGNGSLIKPINQYEIEKEGIVYFKYSHTKDVTDLYFFDQERESERDNLLLVSTSSDSTIQVFNEYDLETTTKLRTLKGGHTIGEKKCDIICLAFSPNLCQFATGGTDGLISVWDFEYSKIIDILYFNSKYWGIKLDVLCLKYLNDYPLLFSSYSFGICALWGIYPLDRTPILILKFHNFYQGLMKLDFCDVLCCHFSEGIFEDIQSKFINKLYFVDTPEFIRQRNQKRFDPITGDELPQIKREDIEKESIVDNSLDPLLLEEKLNNQYDKETLERVKKENPRDYEKKFLIICDRKGFIKVLDFTGIFGKYKSRLTHPENFHILGSNFNLLKKDDINAETFLSHSIRSTNDQQKKYYKQNYNNLYANNIIKTEWRGHLDEITSIEYIEEPTSLVTVSKDMHLRVWDEKLELIGEIDIFSDEKHKFVKKNLIPWNFHVNEKAILEREINEIVEMIEAVGIKPFEFGSKEDKENQKLKIFKKEDEKKEEVKQIEKEIKGEKKKEEKEKTEDKKDKFEFTTQYENIFLQNLIDNIDYLFKHKNANNQGFGEISNKLINLFIHKKEKEKEKKDNKNLISGKEKRLALLASTLKNSMINDKAKSKNPTMILNFDKGHDVKSENLEHENNKIKTIQPKLDLTKFGNTFTPAKLSNLILNLNKNEKNYKENSKLNSQDDIIIKPKIDNELNIQDNTSNKKVLRLSNALRNRFVNDKKNANMVRKSIFNKMHNSNNNLSNILSNKQKKLKRNFSSGVIQINGFNNSSKISKRPKTGKDNHAIALNHIPNNIDRNTLYSQKLFLNSSSLLSQTKRNFFPTLRDKLAEVDKNNNLNYNMKEKTEDLVKNQFYLNSYKNCCKIIPNNSLSTNTSIMMNYKNMWDNVKSFTNSVISKSTIRVKKSAQTKRRVIRSRSVSGLFNQY